MWLLPITVAMAARYLLVLSKNKGKCPVGNRRIFVEKPGAFPAPLGEPPPKSLVVLSKNMPFEPV